MAESKAWYILPEHKIYELDPDEPDITHMDDVPDGYDIESLLRVIVNEPEADPRVLFVQGTSDYLDKKALHNLVSYYGLPEDFEFVLDKDDLSGVNIESLYNGMYSDYKRAQQRHIINALKDKVV